MKHLIEVKGLHGHIILMCKHHYKYNNLLSALRMLWAIRCGYEYKEDDKSADRYIANDLYELFMSVNPEKALNFHETIHEEICNTFRYPNYSPLEILISLYCSELSNLTIRQNIDGKWISVIKLPKPKKQLLNRIFRGNGRYDDYKLFK